MTVQLSRGQFLVLEAASRVDYLPFRAENQTNLRHGVWRSLVIRGYIRQVPNGWEITPEGRQLLRGEVRLLPEPRQRREYLMVNGKLPRYCVGRLSQGWAVIDRHAIKPDTQKNVVEILPSRHEARMKVGQLNLQHLQQNMEGTQDGAADRQ